jgi:hypothetical protein
VSELTLADILASKISRKFVPEIGWRTWRVEWGPDEYRGVVSQDGVEKDFSYGFATLHHVVYSPSLVLLSGWRTLWPKREELQARCSLDRLHFSPDANCDCGIYAFRSPKSLWPGYMRASPIQKGWSEGYVVQRIFGEVCLWGQVIRGTRGWRAEYAYPRRLYIPTTRYARGPIVSPEEIAFHLGDYGVPVEIVEVAENLLSA